MLSKEEIEKANIWINKRIEYIAQNCDLEDEDNKRALECLEIANKSLLERQELAKEMDKKSKIIDEMALAIASYDIDVEICKNLATPFCNNEPLRVTADVCANCIKQYFEKKVEKEKCQ